MAMNGTVSVQYWLLKQKTSVVVKVEKDQVEVPHSNGGMLRHPSAFRRFPMSDRAFQYLTIVPTIVCH